MIAKDKRWAILGLGWGFVLLGIVGLIVPILQGIVFLCVGLMLLSPEWAPAQRMLDRLRIRFPKVAAASDEAERRSKIWLGRIARKFNNATGRSNGAAPNTAGHSGTDQGKV